MSELMKLITQRKVIRSRVTSCYNRRDGFRDQEPMDRAVQKAQLEKYQTELQELNLQIQGKKAWDSDEVFEGEIVACEEYEGKLIQCITILNFLSERVDSRTTNSNHTESARSLLRQPIAPLPTFSGMEREDFLKFIREFDWMPQLYKVPIWVEVLL